MHTGRTPSTIYYWADPKTDAALYHTGVNDEEAIAFFETVGEAENYLEKRDESNPAEDYSRFSLYRARVKKEMDAVDVLMDQSGLADFAPDGGYPETSGGMQIDNPAPAKVWFWYDSAVDYIVQEEPEPFDLRGVFETEEDACRFLHWYADGYGEEKASHLELYTADITYEGHGGSYLDTELSGEMELPVQADIAGFQTDQGGTNNE